MRRRIPFIAQMSTSDCGYACLAMSVALHGGSATLAGLRRAAGEPRGGVRASDLIELAAEHGLRARGYRTQEDAWHEIPRGSILHLDESHFVVFDQMRGGGFDVVDPAAGRRHLSAAEVRSSFSGVVIHLEPGPAFRRGRHRDRRLARYVRALGGGWSRLALVMAASLALVGVSVALPLVTGLLVDRVIPAGNVALLGWVAAGTAMILVVRLGLSWLREAWLVRVRTALDQELTGSFMAHLLALPCSFFVARGTGDLVQRLRSNAQVRELLTNSAISGVLDGLLATGYLVAIFVASPMMGAVSVSVGSVFVTLFAIIRRRRRELSARSLHSVAKTSSFEVGVLDGIETIKSMGAEAQALARWNENFRDVLAAGRAQGKHEAAVEAWTSTLRSATPLVLILFGAQQVLTGALSLGTMLALCALAGSFLQQLGALAGTAMRWPVLASHVDRLADVLEAPPERNDGSVAPRPRGEFELRDVTFAYDRRQPPILRGLDLDVAAGSFVALVGASGTGKSTLARLLAALYTPQAGTIRVDGREIGRIQPTSLRRHLGVVTQDPHLVPLSVRDNIALAQPDLPMERIVEAAKLAEIHEDIMRLPLRYQTRLDAADAGLSGGQRQRIALARALAHRPAILILDEATSALDPAVERRIHGRLAGLRCTRVVVSHRLSTVRDADLIAVLKDGAIVEAGTHDALLARSGEYARLLGTSAASGRPSLESHPDAVSA